jgi:glyoxylase-like metal-dependent hydrolase (beta-lactamase superfamily II)
MSERTFASQGDLEQKQVSFTKLAEGAYAYTAEGDPNSGIVVGDDGVMVIDTQATPDMAQDVIARVREVTDKPVKYVVLTHYHAVRVLGASAYGADHVIASRGTLDLIEERGRQDMESEIQRFPRLFQGVDSIPGLTWPTIVFDTGMTLFMGDLEVRIEHLGRGHTKGDTVVWLPKDKVLFAGDLVEYGATPYTGDAYLTDWPATLDAVEALGARAIVPGRGDALVTPDQVRDGIAGTRAFITDLLASAKDGIKAGHDLKRIYGETMARMSPDYGKWVIFEHCMPFDVSRAVDEAGGVRDPRIWTAERDVEMWKALES